MISSKPEKEMLRFSEAAESVVVGFIDPKFTAVSIVGVDLEGNRMNRLFSKIWSSMVRIHMIEWGCGTFSRKRRSDH